MRHPDSTSTIQKAAIVAASIAVLLPLTIAKVVEWVLKSTNPDGVDVTHGLAYLSPILIAAWVSLGVCIVGAVVLNVLAQRRDGSAKLAWLILALQVVLLAVYLGTTLAVGNLT